MNCIIKKYIGFAFLLLSLLSTSAQTSFNNNDPDASFKLAKELFQSQKYSLAYPLFKQLYFNSQTGSNFPVHLKDEINFYCLQNALIVDEDWAIAPTITFIEKESNAAMAQMLAFQLGEYYYRSKKYQQAIDVFGRIKLNNLNNSEISTLKFHKGYSYFVSQKFKDAKPLFNTIRQMPKDVNYVDANYYFGFISFYEKEYLQALACFKIVENQEIYKNVVPFYIAEINYFLGDQDKALSIAEQAIKNSNQVYDIELLQLVGHIYFDKKKYAKALPYLKKYVAKSDKVRREDLYELAFCYYSSNQWTQCIEGFKQLGGQQDSLAQNSMYLLADAYLKVDDKANARNAFLFCADNSSNATQKEVSSFNYSKLSYDLGLLTTALQGLENYLATYLKGAYINEAKEILVSVMSNTSNYKDALVLFEGIANKSDEVKKIYPKIAYARATELLNDLYIDSANSLFGKVIAAPYNNKQIQLAYFWKGEIAYKYNKINEAITYFTAYLKYPQNNKEINVASAKYNLGYCYLKKENYNLALANFDAVANTLSSTSTAQEQDAFLRAADCNFMAKSYITALAKYEKIIAINSANADYAYYQKAVIEGASGKSKNKIDILNNLATAYPNSNLICDALLEVANTHLANEDFAKSIEPLDKITKHQPCVQLNPTAYLKLGIAFYNLEKYNEALDKFNFLLSNYSNAQESEMSIEYIRNIFVINQKPEEFIALMHKNGKTVTYTEEDSITYKSALLRYEAKDTANALAGALKYTSKFPDGKWILEANFIVSEIYTANKNVKAALEYYKKNAAKLPNKYGERSTIQAARICYFNLEDLEQAEKYFKLAQNNTNQQETKLECMRGILRCQFKTQKWTDALPNAKALLVEKNIAADDKMMCYLIVAKNNQIAQNFDDALISYKAVISLGKSEYSAEAQYKIAEINYIQNKLGEAEKIAFIGIKNFGSYVYWTTKNYLLLGDIYFKQKDYFNAEATFKSVLDNSKIEEFKAEAASKMAIVIEEKNKVNKVQN
jgi:tetratricopeptide (TPR) repeat protein